MQRFEGKITLVTGAGSGIGLATARRLALEGAVVVAAILDEAQRPAVTAFDPQILNVRKEADWDRMLHHVEAAHGGLDVVVNKCRRPPPWHRRGDYARAVGRVGPLVVAAWVLRRRRSDGMSGTTTAGRHRAARTARPRRRRHAAADRRRSPLSRARRAATKSVRCAGRPVAASTSVLAVFEREPAGAVALVAAW
jgi:NAD(P)-dependent dehydrogenase (short-subunit alcohol dehydrogenase family)